MYLGEQNDGEFFDSYGEPPPKIFKRFLDKHCPNWIFNTTKLQSLISKFCGHYCVFYCLFKFLNYELSAILDCFIDDATVNDWLAHSLCVTLFRNIVLFKLEHWDLII